MVTKMVIELLLQWSITRMLLYVISKISFNFKNKIIDKIKNEISIKDNKNCTLFFMSEQGFPGGLINLKVDSKTEVELKPIQLVSWLILGGSSPVYKFTWNKLENFIETESDFGRKFRETNYVSEISPKGVGDIQLYLPLPYYIDFSKNKFLLKIVLEFDCRFGSFSKYFTIYLNIDEENWEKAIEKWGEQWHLN